MATQREKIIAAARELSEDARSDFLDLAPTTDDDDLLMMLYAHLNNEDKDVDDVLQRYDITE